MQLTSVSVQHVRSHKAYRLRLDSWVTILVGKNGTGKTSLLEAVYIALRGSSFRGSDREVVSVGAEWFRIDIEARSGDSKQNRTVKYEPAKTSGKKQFVINDRSYYRLPQAHKYPVVLFEPDDLRLLNGSPTRRRDWIDHSITQYNPQYHTLRLRYERALKQRNNALKQQMGGDALFVWNVLLAQYGAQIIAARQQAVTAFNDQLGVQYRKISDIADNVEMMYSFTDTESIEQLLLSDLAASEARDLALGFTSTGPHRHDISFYFNNQPALTVASRGEVRSIVLALKLLEIEVITRESGVAPVVLLDDVFSELDEDRQRRLLEQTAGSMLITSNSLPSGFAGNAVKLA